MFKRIWGRILGIVIALVLIYVIIPLLGFSYSFLTNIPSWIYYSCCGLGLVFAGYIFIYPMLTYSEEYKLQEKIDNFKKDIIEKNKTSLQIFEEKLNENPTEIKKNYLKLKVAKSKLDNIDDYNAPEVAEARNAFLDLAQSLFGEIDIRQFQRRFVEPDLIKSVVDRISSLERTQETKALESLERRMRKDPMGTRNSFRRLYDEILVNPAVALNLSEELFGNTMLIDRYTIYRVGKKCKQLQAIEEGIITSEALEVYKSKMAENPQLVTSSCNELIETIRHITNSENTGTWRAIECQHAFLLSEKIFGKQLEIEILEKIIAQINLHRKIT